MSTPVPAQVRDLLGVPEDLYGSQYRAHVLDLYKVYVQSADEISKRRNSASTFFLTINTAGIAFLGTVRSSQSFHAPWYVAIALAGVTLSLVWQRTIQSYRDLNTAKFAVIHEIERLLPLKLFDAEWSIVGRGTSEKLYLPVSQLESRVPWVFFGLYVALLLSVFWT